MCILDGFNEVCQSLIFKFSAHFDRMLQNREYSLYYPLIWVKKVTFLKDIIPVNTLTKKKHKYCRIDYFLGLYEKFMTICDCACSRPQWKTQLNLWLILFVHRNLHKIKNEHFKFSLFLQPSIFEIHGCPKYSPLPHLLISTLIANTQV